MRKTLATVGLLLSLANPIGAAELQHQFNSPSFSGVGYSSHILTIKQLEDQQKDKNKNAADALQAAVDRAAANTPEARFLANLENRIYTGIADKLYDSIFKSGTPCTIGTPCGTIPDIGGKLVSWTLGNDGWITVIITDKINTGLNCAANSGFNCLTIRVPESSFN
jgi:hypothetical protein